jgi:broad specificity phosphatase PhoE
VARPHRLAVQRSEAAGEVHMGEWTGLTFEDLERRPEWRRFNTVRSMTRIPGGELMTETGTRIVSELECLRGRHPDQMVAVVSHGDVIKAALAHFAGVPLDLFQRIEIGTGSVSVAALNEWAPRIERINDTGSFDAETLWGRRPL